MESPHEILGVDADADDAAIEDAFRERVKEVHPDQGGSVREFLAVRTAYERLQGEGEPVERSQNATTNAAEPAEAERATTRIEYLNYEVLGDYGWDLGDDDLFEKAAARDLPLADHGRFTVEPGQSLLEAAENHGLTWPYACRGGACSNCAVSLQDGEMPPPVNHVLPQDLIDRGIRLSCSVTPTTDTAKVVFNVKHLPGVDELLLPASRFEQSTATD